MTQGSHGKGAAWRGAVLACIASSWIGGAHAEAGPGVTARGSTPSEIVYVGTQEHVIQALRLDTATGALTALGPVERGLSSTWLVTHPALPVVYSVDDYTGREGRIAAFLADRQTGALAEIDTLPSQARGTTYLWLDKPSMTLLAANYGSGSVSSYSLAADGSLGERISTVLETGSGPNKRQQSAHAHSVAVDPSGRYALVPDLGADRVFIYGFDRATHRLSPRRSEGDASFALPPGSGPRHLAFGASGTFVYLLTELDARIFVLRWDASRGSLTPVQSLAVSSDGFQGARSGAEVAVSRDGRFVYVEDRGENALVVYRVDPASGRLSLVQRLPSGGERPWAFAVDASGGWMLVANQRSGGIAVFGIDAASGKLADTGVRAMVPVPVSLTFVE